jgi:hypothetical protein
MITVRIQGGLGNQMFIYAAGRAWALRNNTELALDTINGGYGDKEVFGRSYKLAGFPIKASTAGADTVRAYRPSSRSFYWLRKINGLLPLRYRNLILEPRRFNPRIPCARWRAGTYLAGYWQREEYFLPYAEVIRGELQPARPGRGDLEALAMKMRKTTSVFIHIRRQKYGYKLTPQYYIDALSIIRSRVSHPNFFVFGDDIPWARRYLLLPVGSQYFEESEHRTEIDDLWLMTQCRHAIVANSSFSWWGAWLQDPLSDKIAIAPASYGYATVPSQGWETLHCSFLVDHKFI